MLGLAIRFANGRTRTELNPPSNAACLARSLSDFRKCIQLGLSSNRMTRRNSSSASSISMSTTEGNKEWRHKVKLPFIVHCIEMRAQCHHLPLPHGPTVLALHVPLKAFNIRRSYPGEASVPLSHMEIRAANTLLLLSTPSFPPSSIPLPLIS